MCVCVCTQDTIDEAHETINKLKRELEEREAVLADNYDTLQVRYGTVQICTALYCCMLCLTVCHIHAHMTRA